MKENIISKDYKQESLFINIIRALSILLVVSGHMGGIFDLIGIPYKESEIFSAYSFHMPAFIFVSGYYFKLNNSVKLSEFIKNKMYKLIIPYYIANVFYGMLTYYLKKQSLFSNCKDLSLFNLIVEPWLSGYQFNLNGPSWFALFLFLVQLVYFVLKKIIYSNDDKPSNKTEFKILVIFTILGFIGTWGSKLDFIKNNSIYWGFIRVLFGLQFYQLGYFYRTFLLNKIPINIKSFLILILSKVIFIEAVGNYSFSMRALLFKNKVVLPLTVSIFGIYYIIHIAYFILLAIKKYNLSKIKNICITLGNNTWSIMMHHMLIVFLYNLTLRKLNCSIFDYVLLPILATTLPILWSISYNKIIKKYKMKLINIYNKKEAY